MRRSFRMTGGVTLLAVLLTLGGLMSINMASPANAQGPSFGTPTPTPNDYLWLSFAAARTAIEEEFSVDLFFVREWVSEWQNWNTGIEAGCNPPDDPNAAIPMYAGWTVTITDLNGTTYQARVSNARDLSPIIICEEVVQSAPPPVQGTPGAGLPTPVPGGAVSGSFALGGHVQNASSQAFALMRRAGMTWFKKQVRYRAGDNPQNSAGIAYITAADANSFSVLLSVVGYQNELAAANFDQYIAQFATYLAGLARAGADAIEVWNEPNIDREWPAAQINGGNYTRMLAAAYNAIKAANPNTLVISGAPAPTGFFGTAGCAVNGNAGGCNDDTFMQQMAQAGAASYMDCVGLHYNEGIVAPTQNSGDPRGEYPTRYFNSMTSRGYSLFGGKPVCYTEFGYLTAEGYAQGLPAGFEWARDTSVQEQASWLASAATLAAQSGRIRLLFVWNVEFTTYNADPQAGFGMLRPDGSCPACDSLGAVMRR